MGLIKQLITLIVILAVIYLILFSYLAFFREEFADLTKLEVFLKTPRLIWDIIWKKIY